ncbi:Uncharacterised protein [Cellulomonas fimi]|nr:Uncharacterised protein [Cellulomonas fimi]
MQQRQLGPELVADRLEHPGQVPQVRARVPVLLGGQRDALRGLVVVPAARAGVLRGDPVDLVDAGHRGLHADRAEPELLVVADRVEQLGQVPAARVPVRHDPGPARAAQQLVERHAGVPRLDVPQRDVDGRDRRHRHGTAPPVRRPVEELPRVLDAVRVATDQQRDDVVAQVRHDGELTPVERGVAETDDAVLGRDAQRDEVAVRAADEHLGGPDRAPGPLRRAVRAGAVRLRRCRGIAAGRGGRRLPAGDGRVGDDVPRVGRTGLVAGGGRGVLARHRGSRRSRRRRRVLRVRGRA